MQTNELKYMLTNKPYFSTADGLWEGDNRCNHLLNVFPMASKRFIIYSPLAFKTFITSFCRSKMCSSFWIRAAFSRSFSFSCSCFIFAMSWRNSSRCFLSSFTKYQIAARSNPAVEIFSKDRKLIKSPLPLSEGS